MKKFRWILLCAALLAAALFALWRLPALFAPSVPAALTYTPPDDETVSAVRAAVQDRFGSDGVVYLLPDCEIDAVSLEYRPLSDPNLAARAGCCCVPILVFPRSFSIPSAGIPLRRSRINLKTALIPLWGNR